MKKFLVPKINNNDDQVQIIRWHLSDGDRVRVGQPIVDLETSKSVVTIDAETDGFFKQLHLPKKIIKVGEVLCIIYDSLEKALQHVDVTLSDVQEVQEDAKKPKTLMPKVLGSNSNQSSNELKQAVIYKSTRFSQAAIKLAEKMGLDPSSYVNAGLVTSKTILEKNNCDRLLKDAAFDEGHKNTRLGPIVPREELIELSKKKEISQLQIGASGAINSTISVEFLSSNIRALIKQKKLFGNLQSIILFEIAQLLASKPRLTSYFLNDQIHFYERVDLGLAIDMGMGLKVARIKDADQLSVEEIGVQITDLCLRYMRGELQAEELIGSTITISDLSALNILHFVPLINGHQAAIIGVGADASKDGWPMSLIMTFDHRILTGRESAIFLNELRDKILEHDSFL